LPILTSKNPLDLDIANSELFVLLP
jgi:hypothetical protein